jgi:hypothetical protein
MPVRRASLLTLLIILCGFAPSALAQTAGFVTLVSDTFDDPSVGVLPKSSSSPSQLQQGYVDGEYQIALVDLAYHDLPAAYPPGTYTDVSVAVDARIIGEVANRAIDVGCRNTGRSGYRVAVDPGRGGLTLVRIDAGDSFFLTPAYVKLPGSFR